MTVKTRIAPSPTGDLHIGHLRNAFLGDFYSRAFRTQGFKTVSANLINDRGVHICKSMLAYKKWGKRLTPKKAGKKSDHFVGDFYVLFSKKSAENPELDSEVLEMLRQWEKGNKQVLKLWKIMNDWAVQGMRETWEKVGIDFDKFYFESKIYKSL